MAEKPTEEMKKAIAEMGDVLQRVAPEAARNLNLHRPYKPQLLADSVKVRLELSDDWRLSMTVKYADSEMIWRGHYLDLLARREEDRGLFFFIHLNRLLSQI